MCTIIVDMHVCGCVSLCVKLFTQKIIFDSSLPVNLVKLRQWIFEIKILSQQNFNTNICPNLMQLFLHLFAQYALCAPELPSLPQSVSVNFKQLA